MARYIKDIFAATYQSKPVLPSFLDAFWIAPVDFLQHEFNSGLLILINYVQSEAQKISIDLLDKITTNLFDDIQNIKNHYSSPMEVGVLEFFQWYIAEVPIRLAIVSRRLQLAHDWIIYSLYDIKPYPMTIDSDALVNRLKKIFRCPDSAVRLQLDNTLESWLYGLFYYSRRTGALVGLGHALNGEFALWLINRFPGTEAAAALAQVLAWSVIHNAEQARPIVQVFESIVDKAKLPAETKKVVMMALATTSSLYTQISPGKWARRVLDEFHQELNAHEPLQLISIWLAESPELLTNERDHLFEAIEKNHLWTEKVGKNKPGTGAIYSRQRLFQILATLITVLLERGSCSLAQEILAAWRRVPIKFRRTQASVFACPIRNGVGAVCYAVEGKAWRNTNPNRQSHLEMMSAMNKFLQTKISLDDAPEFELEVVDESRMGTPVNAHADEFEKCLIKYYRLDDNSLKEALKDQGNGIIILPGMSHPVQPLMIKHWGYCWPLVQSFAQPQVSRPIQNVLLWPASALYTANMESEHIQKILQQAGISVSVVDASEQTLERFQKEYISLEYDCIWIISHGEYDHMNPHRTSFPIAEGISMALDDMLDLHIDNNLQRLLILNLCSGGTAATYGANNEMGIAAAMATFAQCVITHLWPVNWLAAWVFGVLLADAIASKKNHFDAFTTATTIMVNGSESVIEKITRLSEQIPSLSELRDRIERNSSIDFGNLSIWGSPVFII